MVKLQALGVLSVLAASAGSVLSEFIEKQDVRKNFGSDRMVTLHPDHLTQEVRDLLLEHDADPFGALEHHGEHTSLKVMPETMRALKESGIEFKDTTEEWISHFETNFNDPNLFCQDSDEECADREMADFYASYQSVRAIHRRIKRKVKASDVEAKMRILGQSFEGRDIFVVEIGDQTKPLAFYLCNIHAREWLSPMYCAYMIEELVKGHPLLDDFSFAIVPIGNPDGYRFSRRTNNFWRKTRKPNEGSSCVGTDPNRNYDNNFGGTGTSTNPCSDIYTGVFPFDQSETALLDAYARRPDVQNRLITWVDFHSFASMWLSPVGFEPAFPPAEDYDRMEACMEAATTAVEATNGTPYTFGPAAVLLGPAAGASDDYFYFELGVIYSFTVEMRGNSFQPPPSNIMPNNEEVFAGTVAQMECIKEIEL